MTVKGIWISGPAMRPRAENRNETIQITAVPGILLRLTRRSRAPTPLSSVPVLLMTVNAPVDSMMMAMMLAEAEKPWGMALKISNRPALFFSTRW